MDRFGNNGHTLELQGFEIPFVDAATREAPRPSTDSENFYLPEQEMETPFLKTYDAASTSNGSLQGEDFVDFLGNLHDTEFDNIVFELAAEAEESWSNKISNEVALGSNYIPFVTRQAREYFEPLAIEAEAMIDRVAEHFSGNNLSDQNEKEIEAFLNELPYNRGQFTPAQEQFLGGIIKKVGSVVKKGIDLAKKGVAAVGKLLPINAVLGKIKGLVRPLLDKVLKFAIGKLPKNLQPHAQTVAKKFLNLETNGDNEAAQLQGDDEVDAVQTELDNYIAHMVFSADKNEVEDLVVQYETSFEAIEQINNYETAGVQGPSLNEARQQFVNELKSLQPGESPAPAIERFLPAAILALQPVIKVAIGLVGRQKVINFLAGLLARLVGKYVTANVAKPLAASIIDVGMSAIGFETYEIQKPDLGYEAIAHTIEETIQNMNGLNEAALNDNEALTLHLLEAFERAAVNNFPHQYIREDLRQTKQNGTWVAMPRGGPAPFYKKFTRVFDVTIDPQIANAVASFRGLPLANFLKDKLSIDPSKPIQAKVHVYEATAGTRLNRISRFEKVPGLGGQQYGWVQLHPLTVQASSLLLKEPSLGKDVPPKFLKARHKTTTGQRFYFLQIAGARLRTPQVSKPGQKHADGSTAVVSKPSQSGDVQAMLNFVKSEIRLNYYFSEEESLNVVEKLNKNDYLGVAQAIRSAVKNVLNDILLRNVASKVKIVHEAFPEMFLENFSPQEEQLSLGDAVGSIAGKELISKLVEKLIEKAGNLAYQSLGNYFKARAAEFKTAQAQPQDGVTVKIIWRNVQGMNAVRSVLNAVRGKLSLDSLSGLTLPSLTAPDIEIEADKKFN